MDKLIHLSDACDLMEKYASRNPDVSSLCYDIRYGLMRLPTISPDEVRGVGEWMETDAFPHRVYCSNCYKTIVPNEEYAFWCEGIMPRNYCPNCGAKMEVSEDA